MRPPYRNELWHYGILGQKWGVKNGPPYPLSGGDYSESERRKIRKERSRRPNSIYNKKHFDETLGVGTTLSTLSYDKNRTRESDMFYATHKKLDQHEYNALFNKPIPQTFYDKNGNEIGSGLCTKWRISNRVTSDLKVASEDSGADAFKALYKRDRDFYNFVVDPNRMQHHFVAEKYKFRGYREAKEALEKIRSGADITSQDVQTIYRMFNYVIPSDGSGNVRAANDVSRQRAKFFKSLKVLGYGAVLDTNDAIYGGFKATSPVIVFDMSKIALSGAERTKMSEKRVSELITVGRKVLGV